MTRDEILNMPAGRDIDELVAEKVMGWDHNHKINECEDRWYSYCEYCGYSPRFEEVRPGECDTPPRYSMYIDYAWEVVKKLKSQGWSCSIVWDNLNEAPDDIVKYEWHVGFDFYTDDIADFKYSDADSDSVELAICQAALMAVMEAKTK